MLPLLYTTCNTYCVGTMFAEFLETSYKTDFLLPKRYIYLPHNMFPIVQNVNGWRNIDRPKRVRVVGGAGTLDFINPTGPYSFCDIEHKRVPNLRVNGERTESEWRWRCKICIATEILLKHRSAVCLGVLSRLVFRIVRLFQFVIHLCNKYRCGEYKFMNWYC